MAGAMIAGLAKAGRNVASILVVEPLAAQRDHLSRTYGVVAVAQADARLGACNTVVWAVKPQAMHTAMQSSGGQIGDALHISIAAGLPTATLSHWLYSGRVVRAMPNTASLVGAGVTGMFGAANVSGSDREQAQSILAATGYCFWVDDEDTLDAVTALSGSGPAYVFYLLEALQAAGEALGFGREMARDLVWRTAAGAVRQAMSGEEFASLRSRVTSPRGTTEHAMRTLDEKHVNGAVQAAVRSAFERARQLSLELAP